MAIVLENALLADFDPIRVEPGALRIDGGLIVERGDGSRETTDEIVDCRGAVVLPGLVNGHTHLWSSLAVGMPPPSELPQNFLENLQRVWWRLDRAYDAESIETSARIGALDALRCGTTTLFDHHSSPNCMDSSLDLIERGLADVGLRGVLCYETTDRHDAVGRAAALEENRRYLEKRVQSYSPQFAGMVGAHASFTLEDETLDQLAWLAADFDTGVHIHVAEDPCDEDDCQEKHQMFLIDRLAGHKLLRSTSIFVHGTHLEPEAIARIRDAGVTIAHCPRSNMNNGVGTAPMAAYNCPVMLGTDGHSSDMFLEARIAWLAARQDRAPIPPVAILARLSHAARRASDALQITLARLERNAAADVVITDYRPATPLTNERLAAHFIVALGAQHVESVLIGGRWALRDRVVHSCDEHELRDNARRVAESLWQRMAAIPA
jgi:cytosine/adenosine deaminase-related metal-dependent hydrolase